MIEVTLEPTKLVTDRPNELTIYLKNTGKETLTNIVCKFSLPVQLVLLKGSTSIKISRIDSGQKVRQILKVEPKHAGSWVLTSPNFSYRDSSGNVQRKKDLHLEVIAVKKLAAPPPPEGKVKIQLRTTELLLGQWEKLEGVVSNTSSIALQHISLKVVGTITCNESIFLQNLPAGASTTFLMSVRTSEGGSHVPFLIEVKQTDIIGRTNRYRISKSLRVIEKEKAPSTQGINMSGSTFFGSLVGEGTVQNGNIVGTQHNQTLQQKQSLADTVTEIQELLDQLSQTNPTITTAEKMAVVTEAAEQIEKNPTLKSQAISALKQGGTEAFKEAIDHPLVNILVATIEGWKDAE